MQWPRAPLLPSLSLLSPLSLLPLLSLQLSLSLPELVLWPRPSLLLQGSTSPPFNCSEVVPEDGEYLVNIV
jgi:hypothetical protein